MFNPLLVCALAEPELGTESHRRSSSMRVTGTSHRNSVRERSSDDCIIGTHLGMGMFYIQQYGGFYKCRSYYTGSY